MRYNYNYKNEQGEYAPFVLVIDDMQIFNPSAEDYANAGFFPYEPEISHEESTEISEHEIIEQRIENLKEQLASTDYITLKSIEGYDCDTLYPNWKEDRRLIRDEINELEKQL